jgi:hypothetical protein
MPLTRVRLVLSLVLMLGPLGCGKKEAPPEAAPSVAKSVSVADDAPPPPPPAPAPAPAAEPSAEASSAPAPAPTAFEAKIPPELMKIVVAAQKHALATGRFPSSWNEMIAARIVTEIPRGKDGKPMTWKEFERAIDPP